MTKAQQEALDLIILEELPDPNAPTFWESAKSFASNNWFGFAYISVTVIITMKECNWL